MLLTKEAAVVSDVPLLLETPTTVPTVAPLAMLTTGMLVMPFETVPAAPVEPTGPFVIAAELPFTKVATDAFDILLLAALALLAALITAD